MGSNGYILETKDLGRDFLAGRDVVHALREVNMSIPAGKLTILRGPSGSGKTTLINLLGALDYPTAGSVIFDGTEITSSTEKERDALRRGTMGFVFQSLALIAVMSAFENIDFALRISGYDPRERTRRAEECLGLVGLRKRMNHRPNELSGGEQQRVAIARAIAHKPKVVFADEPTAELDTHMGLAVMKVFRELVESSGITIVMTTHDPNMMELGDRVFALEDGVIVDER